MKPPFRLPVSNEVPAEQAGLDPDVPPGNPAVVEHQIGVVVAGGPSNREAFRRDLPYRLRRGPAHDAHVRGMCIHARVGSRRVFLTFGVL